MRCLTVLENGPLCSLLLTNLVWDCLLAEVSSALSNAEGANTLAN